MLCEMKRRQFFDSEYLHRPENERGDWVDIPDDERNVFQEIAARTGGFITPANVIDAISIPFEAKLQRELVCGHEMMQRAASVRYDEAVGEFGLDERALRTMFIDGAQQKIRALRRDGLMIFVDKLDGTVAQVTGTKSRKGEVIDAGRDVAVVMMKLRSRVKIDELSFRDVMMLGGPKALNIIASGIDCLQDRETHTSLFDKVNEAGRALTFVAFDAVEVLKTQSQLDAVRQGMLPYDAVQSKLYEGDDLYQRTTQIKDTLLYTGFATGALAGAVNLVRSSKR